MHGKECLVARVGGGAWAALALISFPCHPWLATPLPLTRLRKVALMVAVVFASGRAVLANYFVSLTLVTALVLHLSVHPFTSQFLNHLEGLSLATSVITQLASFL